MPRRKVTFKRRLTAEIVQYIMTGLACLIFFRLLQYRFG